MSHPTPIHYSRYLPVILAFAMILLGGCNKDDDAAPVIKTGSMWMWGSNQYGGLGDGTQTGKSVPTMVTSEFRWKEIALGSYSTYAIREDGTLWSWGDNSYGQLGDGTTVAKFLPSQIGTDTDWKHVSAGSLHALAIKNDGTLWSWGRNSSGQLGLGMSGGFEPAPAQVGLDKNWMEINAGENYSVALKTDRSLWAWGANDSGQVGDETFVNKPVPTLIGTSKGWKVIEGGFANTFGIKTDGTLWGWGSNTTGQLGVGVYENFVLEKPYQLNEETKWMKISNGYRHVLAIKTDGSLWAWGGNSFGQLGTGTKTFSVNPVRIGEDNDWADVSAGYSHSVAIKKDGSVWAWGQNQYGQVASSEIIEQLTPYKIPGEGKWLLVKTGSGSSFSAGLKE